MLSRSYIPNHLPLSSPMKIKLFLLVPFVCFFCTARAQQQNKDSLVVNSFFQGKANNCASIALIKAGMLRYGYQKMFALQNNGSNYLITLKDGKQLSITAEELKAAKKRARFNTSGHSEELGKEKDSVLFYAYIAYAAIAKYIQTYGYWGCEGKHGEAGPFLGKKESFGAALNFITDKSVCTDYCYRLLGFKIKDDRIFDIKSPEDIKEPGTLVYSWEHAVVAYKNYLDCHGTWVAAGSGDSCSDFQFYIVLE